MYRFGKLLGADFVKEITETFGVRRVAHQPHSGQQLFGVKRRGEFGKDRGHVP
jgi:hypothetical protein